MSMRRRRQPPRPDGAAQQRVVVGATFPAVLAPDKTPWNALSAEKKIAALQFLMKRETDRLLPGMLSSAKP